MADCRAKNAGLSPADDHEAEMTAERTGRTDLGGYPALEQSAQAPVEPGEQEQDEILFELPGAGPATLKLVLTVAATSRRERSSPGLSGWSRRRIVGWATHRQSGGRDWR